LSSKRGNFNIIRVELTYTYFLIPGSDGSANPSIQRIPLPSGPAEMLEEEPLYVNAKQYQRILKRRQVSKAYFQKCKVELPVVATFNAVTVFRPTVGQKEVIEYN